MKIKLPALTKEEKEALKEAMKDFWIWSRECYAYDPQTKILFDVHSGIALTFDDVFEKYIIYLSSTLSPEQVKQ